VTFFERIWRESASAFSKRNGEPVALTPYSRTWKTILERSEHALWVWNDKYGPLTREQRDYAADLICHALSKAGAQEAVGDRYAFFHTELTSLLNHEKVHAGFQRRGQALDDQLEVDVFESVPA